VCSRWDHLIYSISPSKQICLNSSCPALIAIGLGLLGTGGALMVVPSLPEMSKKARKRYPNHDALVNNMTAALFSASQGTGAILSPIYGSGMTEEVGYRLTCDIMAMIIIFYGVLYLLFGGIFKRNGVNRKRNSSNGVEIIL